MAVGAHSHVDQFVCPRKEVSKAVPLALGSPARVPLLCHLGHHQHPHPVHSLEEAMHGIREGGHQLGLLDTSSEVSHLCGIPEDAKAYDGPEVPCPKAHLEERGWAWLASTISPGISFLFLSHSLGSRDSLWRPVPP